MRHMIGTVVVTITALIGILLFTSVRSSIEQAELLTEHSSPTVERRVEIAPVPTRTGTSQRNRPKPTNTSLPPTAVPPTVAPPTSTAVPPTDIPRTPTPFVQNCSSLQTYIPKPGPEIQDCHVWELAFNIAAYDYQDVMFDTEEEQARFDLTYIMYNAIRQLALNCNTTEDEIIRIAYAAGETIDLHGDAQLKSFIRDAPITLVFREMMSVEGTLIQCQMFVAGFLDSLLE